MDDDRRGEAIAILIFAGLVILVWVGLWLWVA